YHKEHLEYENEDFAQILGEYRDGLLLFDLMEKEVWNAAVQDTMGLHNYYKNHKDNYFWEDRVDVIMATAAKENDIKTVARLLRRGQLPEEIGKDLNTDQTQKVMFTSGMMASSDPSLPQDGILRTGLSKIYQYNNAFHVVKVNKLLPKTNKTF